MYIKEQIPERSGNGRSEAQCAEDRRAGNRGAQKK